MNVVVGGRAQRHWLLWVSCGLVVACSIQERLVEERAAGGAAGVSPVGSAHAGATAGAPVGGSPFATGGAGGSLVSPAGASGGMFVGTVPPVGGVGGAAGGPGGCMVPAVTPTCAQAGMPAAGAFWCENAGGAGGAADQQRGLVDDFEDMDDATGGVLNGRGAWFVVNDGTGQQYPGPCVLPTRLPTHRPGDSSGFGLRTFGLGFQTLPEGYASIGVALRSGPPACAGPVDATGYDGVEFWMRGSGYIRFVVATVATTPVSNFGSCQNGCYDSHGTLLQLTPEWSLVKLPFSQLAQEGWGSPAAFDRSQILTLQWSPKDLGQASAPTTPASCFDFWIDDVAFF